MSALGRIRRWLLIRLLLEGIMLVAAVMLAARALRGYLPQTSLLSLILAALALAVYRLMIRWLERRDAVELDVRPGWWQFPAGAALGMALMAAVYAILWAVHIVRFQAGAGGAAVASGFVVMLLAAVFEELLFRAVLFRIVEQACGTTMALLVSAALFGLIHGANPGATLYSDCAIAIEAGPLLATSYMLTRNLWLAIGLHTGWNFAEGSVFGAAVSGQAPSHSLIHAPITGPALLTGGEFGPEASIVSVALCASLAVVFGVITHRRGGWQPRRLRLSLDD